MPKTKAKVQNLVESDFRKIQKLLIEVQKKRYSVDYIRKVCKETRSNPIIYDMALRYQKLLFEFENKLEKLAKSYKPKK